jgi:hypothetical protein
MVNFNYLVRFEDQSGNVHYGETTAQAARSELVGQTVATYEGRDPWDEDFKLSGNKATISKVCLKTCVEECGTRHGKLEQTNFTVKVLSPIASTPIIHGVGLNYKAHADEGNVSGIPVKGLYGTFC